jgi:hypothetical protein
MRLLSIRRFLKRLVYPAAVFVALFALCIVAFLWNCSGRPQPPKVLSAGARERLKMTADITDYSRPESSTYLGYPEWFIVWSYVERADFQEQHLPSAFPWFRSIAQYWSSYCHVCRMTRGKYPFDFGEHLMLAVIGSSFSFEYLVRGIYEGSIGRLAEWSAAGELTEEDRYSNRVAREYADFVHVRPFYEFSFWRRLENLWGKTKVWGRHPIRKLERRFFLSLDYSVEAFYCWIIEVATHASYGYESANTYAWVENTPAMMFAENPRIRKVKEIGAGAYIVAVPRYQEFTTISEWLAERDVQYVEIAGNDEILVSILAPAGWNYNAGVGTIAFETPLAASADQKRVAISVRVNELTGMIAKLRRRGATLEHVYDF